MRPSTALALVVASSCGSPPSAHEMPPPADAAVTLGWRAVNARILDDGSPLRVLGDPRLRNRGSVYGIALNADRSRLATTHEHSIRVWNLPAGTLAFEVPLGGIEPQFAGELLGVTAPFRDGRSRWWNATGHEVPAPRRECSGRIVIGRDLVACAQLAPPAVHTFGAVERTLLLDLDQYELIERFTVSPDGKRLAIATSYHVHMFELATGHREWVRELRTPRECLVFDRVGRLVVADGDAHRQYSTLGVLNAADGTAVLSRMVADYVTACDRSPTDDTLLTVSETGDVQLWALPELTTSARLPRLPLQIRVAAFSADGRSIWAASDEQVLQWELGPARWRATEGHLGRVRALALSPDGDTVATVGSDGRLILWPIAGGVPRIIRAGLDFALTAVTFSLDGKHVAVGSAADTFADLGGTRDNKSVVELWDTTTGARVFQVQRSDALVESLGFSRDGRLYVLDGLSELVGLDAKTGARRSKRTLSTELGSGRAVRRSLFGPAATTVIAWLSGSKGSTWFTVQTIGGTELVNDGWPYEERRTAGFDRAGRPWTCHHDRDTTPCTPMDLKTGARASADIIPVVDDAPDDRAYLAPVLRNGTIVHGHESPSCHAFHPDGKRFIACSPDGLVRVWSLDKLKHVK